MNTVLKLSVFAIYKNANIDTVSVNISVFILCQKSLCLRAFLHFWMCFNPPTFSMNKLLLEQKAPLLIFTFYMLLINAHHCTHCTSFSICRTVTPKQITVALCTNIAYCDVIRAYTCTNKDLSVSFQQVNKILFITGF